MSTALLDCINLMIDICDRVLAKPESKLRIEVKPHVLKDAIAICKKAIPDRPRFPVLANFLLTAKHGRITLTGTNLDTFIEVQLDGQILENGAVCIPASLFEKIVGAIAKNTPKRKSFDTISLTQKDDFCEIDYKSSRQAIACMDAYHFPETPRVSGKINHIPDIVGIFKKLKPYCGNDVLCPTLQSVNIGNGRAIASDGRSLAIKKINSSLEVIIPVTTGLECFDNPGFIIDKDCGFLKFFEDNITVTQRILEGKNYAVDWDIAISESIAVVLKKNELSNISKELKLFDLCAQTDSVKSNKQCIWLEFKPGKITISSFTQILENIWELDCDSRIDKTIYVNRSQLESLIATAIESPVENTSICIDDGLMALKQDDLLLGFMPLPIIKNNIVVAEGCGYSAAVELPCSYSSENNCLTVERNMESIGYARAEWIKYDPAKKVAEMKKQAEEKAAWQEIISNQPEELVSAARNHELTEKLLKDHYKSLANFKASKFGAKEKSWSEAVRSYTFEIQRWH